MTTPATSDPITRRGPASVIDAVHTGATSSSDDNRMLLPPDTSRWDPFVLLSEDAFSTRGFPWHPHRGFQTLTYVLDGRLEHRDSAGGFGVLSPGDAQYMVAGRYALHYELAHELEPVRTLQLWINLPAADKLGPTRYVDLPRDAATVIEQPGVLARLHVGSVAGRTGADPSRFVVPITVLDVALDAGATFAHEVPGDHVVALHVARGAVLVGRGRTPVGPGSTAWLDAEQAGPTSIAIEATEDAFVVAYSGRPVEEEIVFGGAFLMNTAAENDQARAEFEAGRFGTLPDDPTPTDARTR